MKIQLLSDLHLETQPGFEARPAPQADLLVLGSRGLNDVESYLLGSVSRKVSALAPVEPQMLLPPKLIS